MVHVQIPRANLVLLATCILAAMLGSIHSFSVLMIPLENQFNVGRGWVSLTYSLALGMLTLAMLFGYSLYTKCSPSRFVLGLGSVGALGAYIASVSGSLPLVWVGYSLLFGGANGLGYGFCLRIACQANSGSEGIATGIVTASYALGAIIGSILFSAAIDLGGFAFLMKGVTVSLLISALIAAFVLKISQFRLPVSPHQESRINLSVNSFCHLWVGYGAGSAAGLMVIGHATGIAALSALANHAWTAPTLVAASNLLGSIIAGRMTDRVSTTLMLAGLPLFSALSVFGLLCAASTFLIFTCLIGVGLSYGGLIVAYPAAIAKIYGITQSSKIYAYVFTAWGCAGLLSPWLAGKMFDLTASYHTALLTASVLAIVSSGAGLSFCRQIARQDQAKTVVSGPKSG